MIPRKHLNRTYSPPALFALVLACFFLARADGATKNAPSDKSYIKAGYDAYTSGRYDEAIADYTNAIKIDPKNPAYYDYRAEMYFYYENHLDKALADLNKALFLNPSYERAYVDRGDLYSQMSKWDQAFNDYNKAVACQPTNPRAYEGRAFIYDRRRDRNRADTSYTELAIIDHSKAISLDPNYQLALGRRAQDYLDLNKLSLAEADYKRLIALSPDEHTYYWALAAVYTKEHDDTRADAEYRKAEELDPNDARVLIDQGQQQYQKGDYDGAISLYKRALNVHDKHSTRILDFEIGLTYGVEDNSVQAEMYCQRGIDLASQGELYSMVGAGEEMLQAHPQSQALPKVLSEMRTALSAKGPMKYGIQTFGAN